MKTHFKKISTASYLLSIVVLILAGVLVAKGAWNPPVGSPPVNNTAEPLNISNNSQLKVGALGINGVFQAFSNAVFNGNVGVGTLSTPYKLSISGNFGLLADSLETTEPGPGRELVLESPASAGVGTQVNGWIDCGPGFGINCPADGSPNGNVNNAYVCQPSDGGHTYNNDVKIVCPVVEEEGKTIIKEGAENCSNNENKHSQYSSSVTCVSGVQKYSLRTNNGTLEFLNSGGSQKISFDQAGKLTIVGDVCASGRCLAGIGDFWKLTGSKLTASSAAYNVGIGTTNPINKLDVNGGVAIGSYAGNEIANDGNLIVSNSIGIGTTMPTTKLEINGGVLLRFGGGVTSASPSLTFSQGTNNTYDGPGRGTYNSGEATGDDCDGQIDIPYTCAVNETRSCKDWSKYKEVNGNNYYWAPTMVTCIANDSSYTITDFDRNLQFLNGNNEIAISINQAGMATFNDSIIVKDSIKEKLIIEGPVGINTTAANLTDNFLPTDTNTKLFINGMVRATQFSTGDLLFNHNGRVVWRMYEDEQGLYVQSPITGKKYKMMMEEIEY